MMHYICPICEKVYPGSQKGEATGTYLYVCINIKYDVKRKISASLVKWKNSINRMPLVVNGARQVGKTYILEQFGKEQFENVVYMEIESALNKYFETELSPQKIIQFCRGSKRFRNNRRKNSNLFR